MLYLRPEVKFPYTIVTRLRFLDMLTCIVCYLTQYMCRISISVIWDVIWCRNNPSLTLDRPPNTFIRKDRLSNGRILSYFCLSHKALYSTCKIFNAQTFSQMRQLENFSAYLISASSHHFVMTTI